MKAKYIMMQSFMLLLTVAQAQVGGNANVWNSYDDYAKARMKEWNIPGMAVAIVKGDSILLQRTYGYADVSKQVTVNNHTLFALGSCTKLFTTTGLSMLADEHKIDFNEHVKHYIPRLELSDSSLANEITLMDMLSHHTGLERGDYIWYGAGFSREEVIARLKYLKGKVPVRSAFIYNNMMYSLAGKIIEMQSGMTYEEFIRLRIFKPLALNNTYFGLANKDGMYALPYLNSNSNFEPLPMPLAKGVEPAGALWSDLSDMTKWIKFHLNNGQVDTLHLLSPKAINRLKTPLHFTGAPMKADECEFQSYGLGMGFTAYKGYRVMYHTGVAGGFTAHIAFLPEQHIGIIILTNTETYTFPIMDNIFDRLLGLEQTDWNAKILPSVKGQWKDDEQEKQDMQERFKQADKIENMDALTGVYKHGFLHPAEVFTRSKKVFLRYNKMEYLLMKNKDGNYLAFDPVVFGEMVPVFEWDKAGNTTGMTLQLMGESLHYVKASK